MKYQNKIFRLVLMAMISLPLPVFSQNPVVQTFADKNDILIGEQLKVKIKTTFPAVTPAIQYSIFIPDSILHFDIIAKSKADTIFFKDNSKAIEQTITLTSFDSGRWVIPSFNVTCALANQQPLFQLQTDSIPVNVSYSPADSTNQLRDIKPIKEVSLTGYLWYYIAAGILLLLIVAFLLWRYFKKRKQEPFIPGNTKISPYEEAMQELEKLKQYDLQNPEQIKLYHSTLPLIVKHYTGRKQNKNLLNKTTGDFLIEITKMDIDQDNISILASALRCNDAVKFAKYIPLIPESEECMQKIKDTINLIEPLTLNL